jgi:hypothetical protein
LDKSSYCTRGKGARNKGGKRILEGGIAVHGEGGPVLGQGLEGSVGLGEVNGEGVDASGHGVTCVVEGDGSGLGSANQDLSLCVEETVSDCTYCEFLRDEEEENAIRTGESWSQRVGAEESARRARKRVKNREEHTCEVTLNDESVGSEIVAIGDGERARDVQVSSDRNAALCVRAWLCHVLRYVSFLYQIFSKLFFASNLKDHQNKKNLFNNK